MVFDKTYFKKNQRILLFLCNSIFKYWFRWVLRIHKDLKFSEKIISLEPNNYKVKIGNEIRADFRTKNKFARRLYYAFRYYWNFRHWLDNQIHEFRQLVNLPKIELSYDTYTGYPAAGEVEPVDGNAEYNYDSKFWADAIADTTNTAAYPTGLGIGARIWADNTTDKYKILTVGIALFDTSSIGSGASISAAVLSLYGHAKAMPDITFEIGVTSSNPASTSTLVGADWIQHGSTLWSSTVAYADWSLAAYNDMTFNATGISGISLTGITKTAFTDDRYLLDGTEPTWASNSNNYMFGKAADNTGTSIDPKLVITYTPAAAGTTNNIIGIL